MLLTVEVQDHGRGPGRADSPRGGPQQAVMGSSATRVFFRHGAFSRKVVELPNDDRFELETDEIGGMAHYDIGYRWQGVVVLFLPVHHWGGEWCRYVGPDRIEPGNFADLAANANEAGVEMPSDGLGFWWRWGGKLGWLAIFGALVLIRWLRLRQRGRAARSLAAHRGPSIGRGDR
jgi:hypothetical protein